MLTSEKKLALKERIEELCSIREMISSKILRLELELFRIDNVEPVDESLIDSLEQLMDLEEKVDVKNVSIKYETFQCVSSEEDTYGDMQKTLDN